MRERLATGLTLQRVSEELEVGPDLLREWAKQVAGAAPGANADEIFPGAGHRRRVAAVPTLAGPEPPLPPEDELRRLRRENERLRLERDFLKKAAADSTGWCNSFGKYSGWSAKAEGLPGARVELHRDPIEIPLRVGREICPVGEVLS